MPSRRHVDADFSAYIDGEMAAADRAGFEAWLGENPEARARLDMLIADRDRLRDAFAPVIDEAVPDRLARALDEPGRPARAPAWRRIAAVIVIFSLGLAAGWAGARLVARDGIAEASTGERALDAHRTYVSEGRHAVEVGAGEKDHLITWLSKRLGHTLAAPDLGRSGYQLVGGRLLPGGGGVAAAQFMYETAAGGRVTLYVAHNPQGRETAFRLIDGGDARAFYWLDGPLAYALAGDLGEDGLLALARAVHGQIMDAPAARP